MRSKKNRPHNMFINNYIACNMQVFLCPNVTFFEVVAYRTLVLVNRAYTSA